MLTLHQRPIFCRLVHPAFTSAARACERKRSSVSFSSRPTPRMRQRPGNRPSLINWYSAGSSLRRMRSPVAPMMTNRHAGRLSAMRFFQGRAFVRGDMVGLVALYLVLRILLGCVVPVSLVVEVPGVHPDDLSADMPGLRIPAHVIADLELPRHSDSPLNACSVNGGSAG